MSNRKFFVHPLAIFSIIEAWNTRETSSDNALGALIGTKEVNAQTNEEYITIHEAFGIRHAISNSSDPSKSIDVKWDVEALDNIIKLYTQINSDYRIVGWFTTYNKIDRVHNLVHPFLSSKFDEPNLCLITIDPELTNQSLSPKLYTLRSLRDITSGETVMDVWKSEELTTLLPTEERVALHGMMYGSVSNNGGALSSVGLITPDVVYSSSKIQVASILEWIDEKFEKGTNDENELAIGKQLLAILSNIPSYDRQVLEQYLKSSITDLDIFKQLADATNSIIVPPNGN